MNGESYNSDNQFNEDYFLHGREKGLSLYTDYHWMPKETLSMVNAIISHCCIVPTDIVLDFGCARGYVVKAFRELNYIAYGYDVSEWAVKNSDPMVHDFLTTKKEIAFPNGSPVYDWIIAKDVLEHVHSLEYVIADMRAHARKGIFVVVPLSLFDGERYVVRCYEKDVTHIHRMCLSSWAKLFMQPGWSVTGQYIVPGVKDNYARFADGNGFITARRL